MENGKWESYKELAQLYLNENKKVFIKDIEDNYYFCYILFVGESSLRVECFEPIQRKGQKFTLHYPQIKILDKYDGGVM